MSVTLKDVGFDDVSDPVVRRELENALEAASIPAGGRRRRGGGPKEDADRRRNDAARAAAEAAAREVSGDAVKNPSKLKAAVDSAVASSRGLGAAAGATAVGIVAVNRPDILANIAEITAIVLSEGLDIAVTSTYSDWGRALLSIGRGIGVISQGGALQSFQGPVIPFAIATAIMTWRARSLGKTLFQQITADATSGAEAVAAPVAMVAKKAMAAIRPDPMEALFELTERVRQAKLIPGAGAVDLKELVKRELRGEPALESGPAGMTRVVSSYRGPPREPGAPLKAIASSFGMRGPSTSTRVSEAISLDIPEATALGSITRGPASEGSRVEKRKRPNEDEGSNVAKRPAVEKDLEELDGGRRRRKTKKTKKGKRRVTRRMKCTVVKFAY